MSRPHTVPTQRHDPFRGQSSPGLAATTGGTAEAEPATGGLRVPSGSVEEVNAYVDNASGDDRLARATAVLAAEQERSRPRKGVLDHAQAVIDG